MGGCVCLLLDSPAKTIHDANPSPPRLVVMALFSLGASLVGTSISLRSLATPALLVALKVFGNGFVCKRAATRFFGISADSSSYDMLTLYSSLPAAPIAWAIAREQVGSPLALQKDLIQVELIGHHAASFRLVLVPHVTFVSAECRRRYHWRCCCAGYDLMRPCHGSRERHVQARGRNSSCSLARLSAKYRRPQD